MQYRVDGVLIAVGVGMFNLYSLQFCAYFLVDILPLCLSSVYFFYDPYYSSLSLGVQSALYEIDWVKNVHKNTPLLKYYYMGTLAFDCVLH